jgi:hypothetical protein
MFYSVMYTHEAAGGGWVRTQVWRAIYNGFSWYLGKDSKLASYNCGYALLTQSGETIVFSNKAERYHQFQYQLYHYASVGIKFRDRLDGKRIIDLGCGRGGGSKCPYRSLISLTLFSRNACQKLWCLRGLWN